jgi:superfamily II DNA/RNA helicase
VPQRKYFASQCVSRGWCRTAPRLLHVQPAQLLPPQLRHAYAVCAEAKRMAALRVLLKAQPASAGATIVFCKEGRPMERMAEALAGLQESGLPPDVLSDGQHLGTRAAAVRALRDGSRTLLLSTAGMSARGLDIPQCSHVILFDLPKTHEAYTHAAGRCGRMGRPGSVTTICTDKELFVLQRIANSLNLDFEDARRSMSMSSTMRRPRRDKASSSESSESSESS